MLHIAARTIALMIGLFALVNLTLGQFNPGLDANIWWIDLRWLPTRLASIVLVLAGLALVAFAIRPAMSKTRCHVTRALLTILLIAAAANVATYFQLQLTRQLDVLPTRFSSATFGLPLPFSLLVLLALASVVIATCREHRRIPRRRSIPTAALTLAVCGSLFAFGQMFCFGNVDYRRPADAIVVFGARAYADGRLSAPLADRVRTACELYHAGYGDKLFMSGGPGDGEVHETEAMKRYAIKLGVPPEAIELDRHGLDTRATATNTVALFRERKIRRVLAVSNFYHLPRIKMTYQQTGFDVYTVPAREKYRLSALPYLMLREVAALGYYYVEPIAKQV